MEMPIHSAKYSVGIDLGTTHCVLAYQDVQSEESRVEVMSIAQMTAPGTVENLNQLGSFVYQPMNMKWLPLHAVALEQ